MLNHKLTFHFTYLIYMFFFLIQEVERSASTLVTVGMFINLPVVLPVI
jgi:hypothetical protein